MQSRSLHISPSLLSADFSRLGEEVKALEAAGADSLHLDIMDGHFVPNLTFGAGVAAAVRQVTRLPLHAHLMVTAPAAFVQPFAKAGVQSLTVHVETFASAAEGLALLRSIQEAGMAAGITLNPSTPAEMLFPYLGDVQTVLVMTVQPGFGGQAFQSEQLAKISDLKAHLLHHGRTDVSVAVDGGVTAETAALAVKAGADTLVAGTAVFAGGAERYSDNIMFLRNIV